MRNNILTHFFFPLNEPILLSEKLGLRLDNVHDPLELARLKSLFQISLDGPEELYRSLGGKMRPPLDAPKDIVSIKSGIEGFTRRFADNDRVSKSLNNIDLNDPWDFFSKTIVVLQISDHSEIYQSLTTNDANYFFYQEDDDPYYENAVNYSYLISLILLSGEVEENGHTFLLPNMEFLIDYPEPNIRINSSVLHFCVINHSPLKESLIKDNFKDFSYILPILTNEANNIETVLNKESSRKLLYIGGLLKVIHNNSSDTRQVFGTLVSILELLLTHSPDYNRFNIEDSINKQFRLKISIILYLRDKNTDLEFIKQDLKEIYNQRSNISHGNFIQFQKFLAKSKLANNEEYPLHFYHLLDRLYFYVSECLAHYVKDPIFVDFLKDN